ncbi:MAG TPA: TIM barrel protein [Candidatus Dormibacteraeota bacterium]|jgi:sugar phosphate isomerase/epimerase|nr:TIM barrel protein [Candidatus Dormibacteraeota bacterium]
MTQLAVSSWSLHNTLGPVYDGAPGEGQPRTLRKPYGEGECDLLQLPALVADLGIERLEVCHFHFASTDSDYLDRFRGVLASAGVSLSTLLIDEGDPTAEDPAERERQLALIRGWIDVAAAVGAERVRIVAGDAEAGEDAVGRSVEALRALSEYARGRGVQVITENWHQLALDPPALLTILDRLGGQVGLCVDFGNAKGPGKYDGLASLLPHATTVHAKAAFSAPGVIDEGDFGRCLDLARKAAFDGDFVVIFEGPGEERAGVAQIARRISES